MFRKEKLLLFDIDGTLLSTEKAGYEALDITFKEVLNSKYGLLGIKLDGNTDLNAIIQVCERENLLFPDEYKLQKFIDVYSNYLNKFIRNKGHLKPGVLELLNLLSTKKNIILGIVTGNFRKGAYIKLSRFNIAKYFKVGSFGCEDSRRENLIKLAINRAKDILIKNYQNISTMVCNSALTDTIDTIVIGDTPNDILASKLAKVKVLAVATGNYSLEDLAKYKPDWILPDLVNLEKILEIFEN